MVLDNNLLIIIIGAIVSIFGSIFGYLQVKSERRSKNRTEDQKKISGLRNELDLMKTEKEEVYNKLTRKIGTYIARGEGKEELIPLIEEAEQVSSEYRIKEKVLFEQMRVIWEG